MLYNISDHACFSSSNIGGLTKDVKMLAALDDTDGGDRLMDATRRLIGAFSDLLNAAQPGGAEVNTEHSTTCPSFTPLVKLVKCIATVFCVILLSPSTTCKVVQFIINMFCMSGSTVEKKMFNISKMWK